MYLFNPTDLTYILSLSVSVISKPIFDSIESTMLAFQAGNPGLNPAAGIDSGEICKPIFMTKFLTN